MFEQELSEKFQRIFDFKKVTYAAPSDPDKEQECLFINIQSPRFRISDSVARARVTGVCTVLAPSTKLTFGYFARRIAAAAPADTKDLFFFDIEDNTPDFQDIVQRSFGFEYHFSKQYDPALGSIETLNTEVVEE